MRSLVRRGSLVITLGVVTYCCPVIARGQGNGEAPAPVSFELVLPAGSACAFDVGATAEGKAKTIALPGGRSIVTAPGFHVTLTNLSDPSLSVTLNITGIFHQVTLPDGSVATIGTGRNLVSGPVAGLVLAIGRFVLATDASGNALPPVGNGTIIDVCALLR